ncbi:hypothetical protein [Paenibacillus pabuli]|uniref:hypothetical protein n=1 Tax=Paenibacillus pabuli TaxID=1472 RepID=UPI0007803665|nr:hypothetical protein [Paenibacillus pabuli]MEC0128335.1 hypothetical protein [Paenibacillus pabuli]
MTNLTRKIFSMGELKYGWLLLISIVICIATFYVDEHYDPGDQFWLSIAYFTSFTLAAIWGGMNYVGHIRMNNLFRKQNDIHTYVDQLALSGEDKLELKNYLEDFATDLELHGMIKEEAVKEAINQFKAKEFLTMSKYTSPFESHGHHYLLGYGFLAIAASVFLVLIDYVFPSFSLFMLIIKTVLAVYGTCFFALLILYKVLDRIIFWKIKDYFS